MVSLYVVVALVAGQPSWRTFEPAGAGFSVRLPGGAVEKKQTTDKNKAQPRVFVCQVGDGAYVVSVTDFGEAEGSLERRLSNARDGAVESVKGKLVHERKIKLAGHPGRELWIESEKAGMIHTRLFAVGSRLYQTLAIGPKKFVETKDTVRFLDSFKVSK
jgi:hypothetical protein